jgi:hypothetical protein
LIDPNEPHGFDDLILTSFCEAAGIEFAPYDIEVETEYDLGTHGRADIVVFGSDTNILIENKVYSKESSDQTKKYFGGFGEKFNEAYNHFVFLTPKGTKPQSDKFIPLSYEKLVSVLEKNITSSVLSNIPNLSVGLFTDFVQHCREEFKMTKEKQGFSELAKKYFENIEIIEQAREEYKSEAERLIEDIPNLFNLDLDIWEIKKSKTYIQIYKKSWSFNNIWVHFEPATWSLTDGIVVNHIHVEGKDREGVLKIFDKRIDKERPHFKKLGIEYGRKGALTIAYKAYEFTDLSQIEGLLIKSWDEFKELIGFVDTVIEEYKKEADGKK